MHSSGLGLRLTHCCLGRKIYCNARRRVTSAVAYGKILEFNKHPPLILQSIVRSDVSLKTTISYWMIIACMSTYVLLDTGALNAVQAIRTAITLNGRYPCAQAYNCRETHCKSQVREPHA